MPRPTCPPLGYAGVRKPITRSQWRMARAGLEMTVKELADLAGVATSMVKRLEDGEPVVPWMTADVRRIMEAAGVEFIPENGGGAGVRLRRPAAASVTPTEAD